MSSNVVARILARALPAAGLCEAAQVAEPTPSDILSYLLRRQQ